MSPLMTRPVATPQEALQAGADLLVIGLITSAPDPGAAAAALATALSRHRPRVAELTAPVPPATGG
jgi:orotidine-5'-phosphate decarboxylase